LGHFRVFAEMTRSRDAHHVHPRADCAHAGILNHHAAQRGAPHVEQVLVPKEQVMNHALLSRVGKAILTRALPIIGAFTLMSALPPRAAAQAAEATSQHHELTPNQSAPAGELVRIVKEATARFRDVEVAKREGYGLMFGCVTGDERGAMGLHFVNLALVADPALDPRRPEIVIYEPRPDGRVRLIGADFLVFKSDWDEQHPNETPQLMGQLLHLFESPNRFGLPAFYTLHVWAWKDNPTGTFVNWHANVSCDAFNGQTP
jgi:hypothetical protein